MDKLKKPLKQKGDTQIYNFEYRLRFSGGAI